MKMYSLHGATSATQKTDKQYLVLDRANVPAFPRFTRPRARSSKECSAGALGARAFSLKRGSTQQGAAGKPLICLFSCRRTATTSRHLVGRMTGQTKGSGTVNCNQSYSHQYWFVISDISLSDIWFWSGNLHQVSKHFNYYKTNKAVYEWHDTLNISLAYLLFDGISYLLMYLWICCSSTSRISSTIRAMSTFRVSSTRLVQTCSVHLATRWAFLLTACLKRSQEDTL